MIVFDLECENGHTFEGWFEDRADMEKQQEQQLLTCPVCETSAVSQKLSPVSVKISSNVEKGPAVNSGTLKELQAFGRRVTEFVEKNFEDVGADFTREALKMHYGAAESKNIRGTTTAEEDKVLEKEGIPVVKLPMYKDPKEDLN